MSRKQCRSCGGPFGRVGRGPRRARGGGPCRPLQWTTAASAVPPATTYSIPLASATPSTITNISVEAWAYARDPALGGAVQLVTLLDTAVAVAWAASTGYQSITTTVTETGSGSLQFEVRVDAATGLVSLWLDNVYGRALSVVSRHALQVAPLP
jgi:hypothetical protein